MIVEQAPRIQFPEIKDVVNEQICVASDNDFIPIYVLKTNSTVIKSTKILDKKDLTYYFCFEDIINKSYYTCKKYTIFIEKLQQSHNRFICVQKDNLPKDRRYFANAHSLFEVVDDKPVPLFLLCIKYKYLHIVDRNNPDTTQFSLIINNEFINDPQHTVLLRQIERGYFKEMRKHFDFVYTNNIMKICFNNNFRPPKFSTIKEMLNHYSSLNIQPEMKPAISRSTHSINPIIKSIDLVNETNDESNREDEEDEYPNEEYGDDEVEEVRDDTEF